MRTVNTREIRNASRKVTNEFRVSFSSLSQNSPECRLPVIRSAMIQMEILKLSNEKFRRLTEQFQCYGSLARAILRSRTRGAMPISRSKKRRARKRKNRGHVARAPRAPLRAWDPAPIQPSAKSIPRERPVATLLSASLRPLPPLSLHPYSRPTTHSRLWGCSALDDATPSGSAGIPFHSAQPFNEMRSAVRPSVRPSLCLPICLSVGLSVRPSVRPSALCFSR